MKLRLTLLFAVAAVSLNAQTWFDIGVKGAFGPTVLFERNIFDFGAGEYKHKLTKGYNFGARLNINTGHHFGISLEYAAATSKQDFVLSDDPWNTFIWKHNDLLALLRFSGSGAYIELGGKYSLVNKVELDNVNAGLIDDSQNFEDSYFSGVFGFGSYLAGNDVLSINLGIRLHWALNDFVNEAGKENNRPIAYYGAPLKNPEYKTLATAAQVQLEINYAFGRFAKTSCSERWKLILFR